MLLARIGNLLRPQLDRIAANRIRRTFPAARSFVDLGCGAGGIGRRLGATLVDVEPGPGVYLADIEFFRPVRHFDVSILSNVYEHLLHPAESLANIRTFSDNLWMSFTPWMSPFGGHEFAPWHFFGRTKGPIHELGINLHRTSLHSAMVDLADSGWIVTGIRSRYFPWTIRNEFFMWNIEITAR